MKVVKRKATIGDKGIKVIYDPALDDLPIPKRALEKADEARKFLEKHPIPEHLLRR